MKEVVNFKSTSILSDQVAKVLSPVWAHLKIRVPTTVVLFWLARRPNLRHFEHCGLVLSIKYSVGHENLHIVSYVSRPVSFDVNHGISWSWCILFFSLFKTVCKTKKPLLLKSYCHMLRGDFWSLNIIILWFRCTRLCLRYICPAGNFSQPLLARSQTISLALSKMIRNNNNHRFGQNQASVCLELWKFGIRTRLKIDIKLAANIIETTKCVHIY